jgi:integrase/recombinase XerC/integrase/recombinase XerD
MVLNQMIAPSSQLRAVAGAEQMIFQNSLNGFVKTFLLVCKTDGLVPPTLRDYRQKLLSLQRFLAANSLTELKQITHIHIRLYLDSLRATCNSISVADYYRIARRFFNWCVEEELLDEKQNPMLKIKPPKTEKKIIRPFTVEDINKLLLLCDAKTFMGIRNRALILVFLDTGLRLREMTDIQLRDIDIEREIIKVMGKGARERVVRMGKATQQALIKYLLQRRDNFPCLWVSEERKPITGDGIYQMIKRLGKRARLSGVRCSPHTCRHYFGTNALRNGADIRQVQVLLGHATLNMTMNYVATNASEDAIIAHRGSKEHPGFSPVDNLFKKGGS